MRANRISALWNRVSQYADANMVAAVTDNDFARR